MNLVKVAQIKFLRQMLKTHEKVLHLLSVLKNETKGIDKTKQTACKK